MTTAPTLREALEKCRETFAAYAEMHRQKLTSVKSDADHRAVMEKMERNRDMADLCIAALSAQVPEDDLVERCARALFASRRPKRNWDSITEEGRALWRDDARIILEAADRIEALGSRPAKQEESR